jgi:hypothetical protein
MGYMGLSCISDSDGAASVAFVADAALVKVLRKQLKERGNEWNTGGVENVAIYLEERIKDTSCSEELSQLVTDVIVKLETLIEKTAEWEDSGNKRMHINSYKRMVKSLQKITRKVNTFPVDQEPRASTKRHSLSPIK